MSVIIMNMVTPKAGAKLELLFNKPASDFHFNWLMTRAGGFRLGIK
jgi:hypothetical protein